MILDARRFVSLLTSRPFCLVSALGQPLPLRSHHHWWALPTNLLRRVQISPPATTLDIWTDASDSGGLGASLTSTTRSAESGLHRKRITCSVILLSLRRMPLLRLCWSDHTTRWQWHGSTDRVRTGAGDSKSYPPSLWPCVLATNVQSGPVTCLVPRKLGWTHSPEDSRSGWSAVWVGLPFKDSYNSGHLGWTY